MRRPFLVGRSSPLRRLAGHLTALRKAWCRQRLPGRWQPDVLGPGIVWMRGSAVMRLRPCIISRATHLCIGKSWVLNLSQGWGWGWWWWWWWYSFVACLSNWTIDHASLSRRSLVSPRDKDNSNSSGLFVSAYYMETLCYVIVSPSCFAACGHHLSHRIAIVSSPPSSVPNSSMSHSYIFLISSSLVAHPVPPCTFHFSYHVSSTFYCFAARAHMCTYFLLPATGIPFSSS